MRPGRAGQAGEDDRREREFLLKGVRITRSLGFTSHLSSHEFGVG